MAAPILCPRAFQFKPLPALALAGHRHGHRIRQERTDQRREVAPIHAEEGGCHADTDHVRLEGQRFHLHSISECPVSGSTSHLAVLGSSLPSIQPCV